MKIRTDFVTNSSSSSFVVRIELGLKDGSTLTFSRGNNPDYNADGGQIDVSLSPKKMGEAASVADLLRIMEYDTSYIVDERYGSLFSVDDQTFPEQIAAQLHDMGEIQYITVGAQEEGNWDKSNAVYTYHMDSKAYVAYDDDRYCHNEGRAGGHINIPDAGSARRSEILPNIYRNDPFMVPEDDSQVLESSDHDERDDD